MAFSLTRVDPFSFLIAFSITEIEVSKFYEKLPIPHALAVKEWLDGKIYHRNTEEDDKQ